MSVLERYRADLRAVIDAAYKRGAEAMRDAAANCADERSKMIVRRLNRGLYEDEIGNSIRGLPIPKDTA